MKFVFQSLNVFVPGSEQTSIIEDLETTTLFNFELETWENMETTERIEISTEITYFNISSKENK